MSSRDRKEYRPETYSSLTEPEPRKVPAKWTTCLVLCCLAACSASFQFGYNIGVLNLPGKFIQEFFAQNNFNIAFADLNEQDTAYSLFANYSKNIQTRENVLKYDEFLGFVRNESISQDIKTTIDKVSDATLEILFKDKKLNEIDSNKNKLKENENSIRLYWIITNTGFVVGGMIGAFTSKYVVDFFGRKSGILFHNIFTVIGSILVLVGKPLGSTYCIIISRAFFGIQGGMMCGLIPTYLNEISPKALRGATGVMSQLFITVGILVSQVFGFRQLLGTAESWHILLAIPIIPSVVGGLALLLFFPESPKALLLDDKNMEGCRKALEKLRNSSNVQYEIQQIQDEGNTGSDESSLSIISLLKSRELRWPLLTGLILNMTQQLCGINAVFFYSDSIFKNAGIKDEHIQYAVFATGLINVISTIAVVPLIDRLGRKPLLTYPMIAIIIDFVILTFLLKYKDSSPIVSYLSIAFIVLFITCFAVGLGPIPFIYVAEVFRQEARSAAIAICMFSNWVANLLLTSLFPYMTEVLNQYVFLVFVVIVLAALLLIIAKVPETKGRSAEEIMCHFNDGELMKERNMALDVKA